MAGVQFKRMGWFKPRSAWASVQAWRDTRREATQRYISTNAAASEALTTASINLISGSAELAAKAAANRVNAQVKAKFDEVAGLDIKI